MNQENYRIKTMAISIQKHRAVITDLDKRQNASEQTECRQRVTDKIGENYKRPQ